MAGKSDTDAVQVGNSLNLLPPLLGVLELMSCLHCHLQNSNHIAQLARGVAWVGLGLGLEVRMGCVCVGFGVGLGGGSQSGVGASRGGLR